MDFWGKKINVNKATARQQVAIINSFPAEKRLAIAFDFANMGVDQTMQWIKSGHPEFRIPAGRIGSPGAGRMMMSVN